ncbi:MAG TPA: bestrophin family ion channel [Rhizobacter sp.]|nr:bestrophin family ion channel [Rhizobacter sp.]
MKISRSYTLAEFLAWTRRKTYVLLLLALLPVALYVLLGQKWVAVPWAVAVLLGTATSFIVGFKNAQTYGRTIEAQQVWTSIASVSRYWGTIARDFPVTKEGPHPATQALVRRHLAWLTVLRYQLRRPREWESVASASNVEYQKKYSVPETQSPLADELKKYLDEAELAQIAATRHPALRLIGLQSQAIRELYARQELAVLHHTELQKTLKDCLEQQTKAERIKNFPYPRQYATINTFFVWSFAAVLPWCLVREFDRLNEFVPGLLHGHMAWLAVPFSMLVGWMYVSLDQVGESTENPFEGGANDVPISQICRLLEIELRELLGETELPPLLQPSNHIVL